MCPSWRCLPVLFTPSPPACPVFPAQATCWPAGHAVHRKRGAKRPFTSSATCFPMCFWLSAPERNGASSSHFQVLPVFPLCPHMRFELSWRAGGLGERQQFCGGYRRQNPSAGYGLQRQRTLQPVQRLWARVVKTLVQDVREDCGSWWCATWEEGKVCLWGMPQLKQHRTA